MTVRVVPMLCVLFGGCVEFNLDPIEADDDAGRLVVVTDRFVQTSKPRLDVLLVVDRTTSMTQKHSALIAAADELTESLDDAGVSWQAGVVSLLGTGAGAGVLLGQPWVVTPSDPPLSQHLQAVLQESDLGREEAGIAAALLALERSEPGGENLGFRRVGASLHLLFVSDTDDQSDDWLPGEPVDLLLERLAQEVGDAGAAQVSAVVGDIPSGCASVTGSAMPGTRYAAVAQATSGAVVSICQEDYSGVVQTLSEVEGVVQDQFELSQPPVDGQIHVAVDGANLSSEEWVYNAETLTIEFALPPAGGSQIDITYVVVVDA